MTKMTAAELSEGLALALHRLGAVQVAEVPASRVVAAPAVVLEDHPRVQEALHLVRRKAVAAANFSVPAAEDFPIPRMPTSVWTRQDSLDPADSVRIRLRC
jgi:hypothetical protein